MDAVQRGAKLPDRHGASNARAHGAGPVSLSTATSDQGWALACFAAITFGLFAFAVTVAKTRDA
ncbi:hypothetical protein [Amycolatopsis sp. cmx-4-61]|uniref:hypothetical protein n=1 Tax=Amycolatopsis sp. cmx-4-61 TaxID=2790937 RepID=UPI003979ADB9